MMTGNLEYNVHTHSPCHSLLLQQLQLEKENWLWNKMNHYKHCCMHCSFYFQLLHLQLSYSLLSKLPPLQQHGTPHRHTTCSFLLLPPPLPWLLLTGWLLSLSPPHVLFAVSPPSSAALSFCSLPIGRHLELQSSSGIAARVVYLSTRHKPLLLQQTQLILLYQWFTCKHLS